MSKATTLALVLGAAALAGTGVYLPQQRQLQRVRAEYRDMAARQTRLIAERDEVAGKLQARGSELEGLQIDRAELTRLREEVALLRRERDTLRLRAAQSAPMLSTGTPAPKPEGYIARDQLAYAGYDTPEAALVTMTWAMMSGDYEQSLASLGPELRMDEMANEDGPIEFEARRQVLAPLFKGLQILASKALSDDIVELKVQVDSYTAPGTTVEIPSLIIQPMVKVGNEWRLGNAERAYEGAWDQDSQPETPTK